METATYHHDQVEKIRAQGYLRNESVGQIAMPIRLHITKAGSTYGFGFWIFWPRPAPPKVLMTRQNTRDGEYRGS